MDIEITAFYFIRDNLLKSLNYQDNSRCRMSTAEVRKKNSKRKYNGFLENSIKFVRKRIESAFSVIKQRFPAHIHAVTHKGFELKVLLFVLAYGIEKAVC